MKSIKLLIVSMIIAVSAISCADYLDVNTDPNNPLTVSNDLVLPVAQRYSSELLASSRRTNSIGNLFMMNWSNASGYSWYDSEMTYNVSSTFYNGIWDATYQNALKQYHVLDNDAANNEYYQAIGKIMKSYHFQILVDIYGDVPYFDALQRGENTTPAFDDAQTIYEDLIVQLDNAIALIKAGNVNADVVAVGSDDKMFAGNMTTWIKLANTIKLRILARQSSLAGRAGYIGTEITKIMAEGTGFLTEDATNNLGYVNEENKQNPFWDSYGIPSDATGTSEDDYVNNYKATCATPYVLNKLTTLNDPRIDFIYEKPAGGHRGVVQGITPIPSDATVENVSNMGPGLLKSFDQDAMIFTLAEAKFLQAELALMFPTLGNPETFYQEGIAASFNYLGATGSVAYFSQPLDLASYSFSSNKLEAIITQKWIALNGIDAIQSWFDYNRLGYPSDMPISLSASGPNIPVRLAYSSSEISSNAANVPTQPDVFSAKIFWAN